MESLKTGVTSSHESLETGVSAAVNEVRKSVQRLEKLIYFLGGACFLILAAGSARVEYARGSLSS